jgi:hypothetical protein
MAVERSIGLEKRMENSERTVAQVAQINADAEDTWEREKRLTIVSKLSAETPHVTTPFSRLSESSKQASWTT